MEGLGLVMNKKKIDWDGILQRDMAMCLVV